MPIAFSKKDLNSTAWFSLEKLIHLITGVFIVPKIFNTLGTVDIGKLKFVESVMGMFTPLFFLGLAAICIREIVFKPSEAQKIIATTFFIRLISWLITSSFILIYLIFSENISLFWLYIIIAISYLFRLTDIFEFYLLAKKRAKLIFIGKTTSLFCIIALQYYGVSAHWDVSYFAEIIALDFLLQGVFYIVILSSKNELNLKEWRLDFNLAKQLLKMALPLIISEALIMFYIGIDELFLKYYHNDHANGIFASVQFLVIGVSWTLGFAIVNAIYPSLAESYKTNYKMYVLKNKQLCFTLIALGLIIALIYTFFGNSILDTYFSEQYNDAKTALHIFCWAPLFIFFGMLYEKHLLTTNRLQHNVYRFAIGCVINCLLCYLLIPKYHVNGAAIAVLVSHFITNIGYIVIDNKSRKEIISLIKYA
ncbi:flippase [Lacinutrix undariae]